MKRKGFTLVELLVVIAIIALLMGILMPTLSRVRLMAQKLVCGTRQAGIVKACLTYAAENDKDFPTSPIKKPSWGTLGYIPRWDATVGSGSYPISWTAYGYTTTNQYTPITVSSSLYLLVKYYDVSVEQFICKGDTGATPLKIEGSMLKISDVWDFGGKTGSVTDYPGKHVSYAYHMPYQNLYFGADDPGRSGFHVIEFTGGDAPVLADRNPYLDKNCPNNDDDISFAHRKLEGMNVCYKDGHVDFETSADIGMACTVTDGGKIVSAQDNIWSHWTVRPSGTARVDVKPKVETADGLGAPYDTKDAYLVMETNNR